MPQPGHVSKLGIPEPASLDKDLQELWAKCVEKLGFVPNVFSAYSLKPQRLRNFMAMYNDVMLAPSGLSKLEREMIAVVVSSANRCYYCLVAHGAAVRQLSGDPELGEMLVINYRVAELSPRDRTMLDFVWKLTSTPHLMEDADRDALSQQGFSNDDIFDIAETAAFFNLSNRMASALDMMPNREYHRHTRHALEPGASKTAPKPATRKKSERK